MLPELVYNQNIFIEITNLDHGGQGWELGTCLWSPVRDKGGAQAWQIMNDIRQGDIILHLVDIKNQYHWYGISLANSNLIETRNQPPLANDWSTMLPYQRINLTSFNKLNKPIPINNFFNTYDKGLRQILLQVDYGQFYIEYGKQRQLRVAQRYIAKCPTILYDLFNSYSTDIEFNPIFGANVNIPTLNEPQNPDYHPPGRQDTIVSRIIRDTELSRDIKAENDWRCQICGSRISLPNNNFYAEGHHLQPLGGEHQGPDIRNNIIIVCPTHHTEFDYGSIAINANNVIEHIDVGNPFHNQQIAYLRNDLGRLYLDYHYQNRFRRL